MPSFSNRLCLYWLVRVLVLVAPVVLGLFLHLEMLWVALGVSMSELMVMF